MKKEQVDKLVKLIETIIDEKICDHIMDHHNIPVMKILDVDKIKKEFERCMDTRWTPST